MRLDAMLTQKGYCKSRTKAAEAIREGKVKIDGRIVDKPSCRVSGGETVQIDSDGFYVSRSAMKLKRYLESFPIEIEGAVALDIGSSTGGFTQVLLEYGVGSVDAVDVGRDQMDKELSKDKKINLYESTDIRDFISKKRYDLIVSDVSFISLSLIIPSIDRLSGSDTDIILLFKPQFEVGPDARRDSRGVVMDSSAISLAMERFESDIAAIGWSMIRKVPSQLKGKSGNQEYIYHLVGKDGCDG